MRRVRQSELCAPRRVQPLLPSPRRRGASAGRRAGNPREHWRSGRGGGAAGRQRAGGVQQQRDSAGPPAVQSARVGAG